MSTSILYHAFGLKGIEYKATHFVADRIIFSAEMNDQWVRCPQCGCRQTTFKGRKRRWFYMTPIGRKKCMLESHFAPFEVQGVLDALVAHTAIYGRDPPLCSILCPDSLGHAPVQHDPLGGRISRSWLGHGQKHP